MIQNCDFSGSDWDGCDFEGAFFAYCNLERIKNTDRALSLASVRFEGPETKFQTAVTSWRTWLDWERLGTVGKLPLFGVSAAALVGLPIYFYFIAHYNHSLDVVKTHINSELANTPASPLASAIAKLPKLPIPTLSTIALISALLLAVASFLYSVFCPPLPKQFSLVQWRHQFQQPPMPYLVQSWSRLGLRITCAIFYFVGGIFGAYVLSAKLWQTAVYIWHG